MYHKPWIYFLRFETRVEILMKRSEPDICPLVLISMGWESDGIIIKSGGWPVSYTGRATVSLSQFVDMYSQEHGKFHKLHTKFQSKYSRLDLT